MDSVELKYLLLVSLLLTFSFPPFPTGFLAPVALVIFIRFLREKPLKSYFRLGYLLGLFWGAFTLFWIAASTLPGAILAISINALHYALLWWLFGFLRQKKESLALFSLPVVWVALEYLRLFSDLRFNWLNLAYTQTYFLPFIQFAEYTGYDGVSFLVVLTTVILYYIVWGNRRRRPGLVVFLVLLIGGVSLWGFWRMEHFSRHNVPLVRAALVQPNVDPYQKWDPTFQQEAFRMLMEASEELAPLRPHLIVWPETATPFYLRTETTAQQEIHRFVDSTGICLLTGTPDYAYFPEEKDYHTYNAAFFFTPGRPYFETYYKMALVPAAESMPFKKTFPFLRKLDVGGGDFFPGEKFSVFEFKIPYFHGHFAAGEYRPVPDSSASKQTVVKLAAVICYESVFPHIVREFIQNGANLLTIITNDGWFGVTNGPFQHYRYAVYRAIENRVSIIRCANTGISGFIDPLGRVLEKAPLETKRNLIHWIPVRQTRTFYSRHGEWFGKISLELSFALFFIIFSWLIWRKKQNR